MSDAVSLLDHTRLKVISHAIHDTNGVSGEIWECGAYRGGTALYMKTSLRADSPRIVRAFDTFSGLPFSRGDIDTHPVGAMAADYDEVMYRLSLPNVYVHRGIMPETFKGLEDSIISVAHIDVDQYESVRDVLAWVYPRVHENGWIILDDYGCKGCPGAKKATDEFLADKPERLVWSAGDNPQAHFIKRSL